ncbi:MAG: hypothetical protein N3A01_05835 [Bacteroidales bacterium]|nr:hypothetical protein [Bacteroidales bacterium]
MKSFIILIIFTTLTVITKSQTVIEMMHPGDANIILLEVDKPENADIIVYKTNVKEEYEEWNCKWKFKKWGFANFSVYITKDPNDSLLYDDELGIKYNIQGKIYFTTKKEEARYVTPGFQLEGVLRKTWVDKSKEAVKSKEEYKKLHREDEE